MKELRVVFILLIFCALHVGLAAQTPAAGTGPAKKPHGIKAKTLAAVDSASYGIGYNLVTGVSNAATDAHLGQKLTATSDSLVKHLSISSAEGLAIIRDTMLTPEALHKYSNLRDSFLGDGLRDNIRHAMDAAVGDSSAHQLQRMVRKSIDEAFSKKTGNELKNIIDTVGKASNFQIKSLLDTLLTHVDSSLISTTDKLKNSVHTATADADKTFVNLRNALIAAIVLVIFFIGGCIYLMRLKMKYSDVTSVLTYQIENMPENISKEEFKQRIQNHAQSAEVEDFLHDILVNKKMAGEVKENPVK